MAGLNLNMGLGAGGAYSGPIYGADSPYAVPASQGYADTSSAALLFGPGVVSGGGRDPGAHAFVFGLGCFAVLIFFAWALPR